MRVTVLINPNARLAHNHDGTGLREQIEAGFAARGIVAQVVAAAGEALPEAAAAAVEAARRGEVDAVIAGGGDGSIGTVAGLLAGSGIPLGILPLGTLNHFARDLGIPPDLDAAIGLIADGATRAIDVAEVNGHAFVNNSSVGFYAILVLERERLQNDRGLSKWAAMMLACLRLLRRFSLRRLTVAAEGRRMQHRTPLVFVGNNAYRLHPPELGTRACLDDGRLWICVARQQNRRQLLWLACRSLLGLRQSLQELEIVCADSAEIESRASRLPVAVDGEVRIMHPPLRYRARPGALQVFAPPRAIEPEPL